MDPLHITLLVLLAAAVAAVLWLVRDRIRLTTERDVALGRNEDSERMRVGFQAVAGEVLRNSNSEFLKLAKESLASSSTEALHQMDEKQTALDELIRPLRKAVEETHQTLRRAEKDSAGVRDHLNSVTRSNRELRTETSKLAQALRKPNVRGRYGELQLERVVELAGMRSYCDFTSQATLRDADGRLQKPDLVVNLPNGRIVAIDAKTPLDGYMDAIAAEDADERDEKLDRYAQNFVEQVKKLAAKEYWENFAVSPELVVMFVPGDQLVDAALERRPDLIELAAEKNVVIASPSTLIGLLRAVHVGWRERNLSENAEELFRLGRELHQRAAVVIDRAARLGESLDGARRNYNLFVGSVQTRLIPTLRKFEEKDARSSKNIEAPQPLEEAVREIEPIEADPINVARAESVPDETAPDDGGPGDGGVVTPAAPLATESMAELFEVDPSRS
jgi:DNA recombination protein RmuC